MPKKPAKKLATKKPATKKKKPAAKKPAAKPAATQKPAAKKPAAKPAASTGWSPAVLAHVASSRAGFAAHLSATAPKKGWKDADTATLRGLEAWGAALTALDKRAGIHALVAAAQHGFPQVVAAGGSALDGMGFTGSDSDPIVDGAAVEVQLLRAGRFAADASAANKAAATQAYDRTRQLHVWEEDLYPAEDQSYYWYLEVGQCALAAIVNRDDAKGGDAYYGWKPADAIGRGLVMAARGLRRPGADLDAIVDAMGAAIAAAF